MEGIYKIADCVIRIVSIHERVHRDCADYRVEGLPEHEIRTSWDDIAREREIARKTELSEHWNIDEIPEPYLESLAAYRKLADWMPARDTLLFHGSAICVDERAYLFTARSGTGKSTHVRLWRELLGDRAVMINDDKPLIRVTEEGAIVYGTPWNGKHHLGNNVSAPLRAICLLERSETNHIRPVSKMDIYPTLVQQAYRPRERWALDAELTLLDRLNVRFYRLGCNMEPEAALVSFRAMSQEDACGE